jgi:stress-induced-phosphoprotein 1
MRKAMEDRAEGEKQKNLGNHFYKKKKFPEAIQHYCSAIELHPEELTYYTNLAAVYLEIKEYERAIEQCDHAINKARESDNYDFVKMGKALARKANCLFRMDKLDEAIAIYNEALLEDNNYDIKEAKKKNEKHKKELEDKAYINPEIADMLA